MAAFLINNPKCVFIHIHKTGGTSIRHGYFKGDFEGPAFGAIPQEWKEYFAFAFVRNPFDRLISAWKMFSEGVSHTQWQYPEDGRKGMSLQEFLGIVTDERIDFGPARKSFEQKIRHHTIPQTHPFNCLHEADFVGNYENFVEDFANVCKCLALDPDGLPRMNTTQRGSYQQYFDPDTRSIAEMYYAEDMRRLGYSFEEFNSQSASSNL